MGQVELIVFLVLLALGYGFGRRAEKRHYRSIIEREKNLADVLVFATRHLPEDLDVADSHLVGGSAVISVDYFKQFVAGMRNLFGGRMTSYESLIDRARREAVLRMKASARDGGAQLIFNIKYETASISKGAKDTIGSIEVYAYGTAVKTRS